MQNLSIAAMLEILDSMKENYSAQKSYYSLQDFMKFYDNVYELENCSPYGGDENPRAVW